MIEKEYLGIKILFDEIEHVYYLNERKMISVTQLVDSLFPEFDEVYWAEKLSKNPKKKEYYEKNIEEILKTWKDKNVKAKEIGTNTHIFAEKLLNGQRPDVTREGSRQDKLCSVLLTEVPKLLQKYEVVRTETTIFLPDLLLSGTVDMLLKDRLTGQYIIGDWKTNEEIKLKNWIGKGLDPVKHLDDCNFNHYSLQLGLYQYILEHSPFLPYFDFKKILFHITEEGIKEYECVDMSFEINMILNNRRRFINM